MKRRSVLAGLAALVAAGAAWRFHVFGRYYPPTPYDDLLDQIADREPAFVFGKEALKIMPGATALKLAANLRADHKGLSALAAREPGQNRIAEVDGWVVPRSVALYAALAASV